MESIAIAPSERKGLIIEMKRERRPSRRLRMHIALLADDGRSPTEISGVLFCSRATVYAVVSRFVGEGRAAFDDREPRGPRPLLGKEAGESGVSSKRTRPPPMAGCALAGAASSSPCSF
ncbi:MAG: helix-turn-helix domain-containing protein [Actinomycetota bacterium]|jgi:hypothetical protein|nr:helix-turn-helix domain-containing protein [Rubrobacter sp.]MDQ3507330.1 helix-turn-helix domain-containing protein [Actinomycetota bacterium]